jgi:hypothetical protein
MTPHKRSASPSPEETDFDDPWDEVDSEWERITQNSVERVAFGKKVH